MIPQNVFLVTLPFVSRLSLRLTRCSDVCRGLYVGPVYTYVGCHLGMEFTLLVATPLTGIC